MLGGCCCCCCCIPVGDLIMAILGDDTLDGDLLSGMGTGLRMGLGLALARLLCTEPGLRTCMGLMGDVRLMGETPG